MGKSSPAPVDYEAAALAEGEAARDITEAQTWANRPNQINPWGSVNWYNEPVWDPTTEQNINRWTQTQELSPALNDALSAQMGLMQGRSELGLGMMGNIASDMGTPMDWSQFGDPHMIESLPEMSNIDVPSLWGHLQYDIPEYRTEGQLKDINLSQAPDVMAPQFGIQRAEDAIFGRQKSRLDNQFNSEELAMDIKLRNQGLVPGDEAYEAQKRAFNIRKNDAYQNAGMDAIIRGGQEAERLHGMEQRHRGQYTDEVFRAGDFGNQARMNLFNQGMGAASQGFANTLQAAQFQNQARDQMMAERLMMMGYNRDQAFQMSTYYNKLRENLMNEEMMRRSQALNEANALIAGQQVTQPQFTSFMGAQAPQAPQLLQAAGMQGQQNAAIASADNAAMQGLMSGMGSLAGMAGMFSDRRLKSNIRKIGERNGVNWYAYEIFGKPQIGVMADEVPWAAFEHPSGYLMVDYRKV